MARLSALVPLLLAAGALGAPRAPATPAQRLRGAAPNATGRPSLSALARVNATILSDIATGILPLLPSIALEAKEGLEPPGWKAAAERIRQSWTQALPEVTLFGQALADDGVADQEVPLLQAPWQILSLASQAMHDVLRGEASDLMAAIAGNALRMDPVLHQRFQSAPFTPFHSTSNNYTDLVDVLQEAFTEKAAELRNTGASGFMPNALACASLIGKIYSSYIEAEASLAYASTDCSPKARDYDALDCAADVANAMSSLAQAIASFSKTKFNCFNVDTGCMTEAATVVQRLWETASHDISAQADCSVGTVWCVSDLLGAVNALAEASTSLHGVGERC
jgi:hypothetical protein